MANENTTSPTVEIDPLHIWEDAGVIDALLPVIREVYPRFVVEDHDVTFNQVTWSPSRSGWIGSIFVDDEEGNEVELSCFPLSSRWEVDPSRAHMVLAFRVLSHDSDESGEDDDDLTDGRWYAVPVALVPTSVRIKAEKAFQETGLLKGRLPGLRQGEWDDGEQRRVDLTFHHPKRGRHGDLLAWFKGKACVIDDRCSTKPRAGDEVVCEVVCERLNKVFVRYLGMTTRQLQSREGEIRRMSGLRGIRRAKAVERPALPDLVAAQGLDIEKLTGGKIGSAYGRLRHPPTTEEEAGKNSLARAMAAVGLPFKADDQNWGVFYADYLYQANSEAVAALKARRAAEQAAKEEEQPSNGGFAPAFPEATGDWDDDLPADQSLVDGQEQVETPVPEEPAVTDSSEDQPAA